MPQKSYLAKANKGKALQVFLNNWVDHSKRVRRNRQHEQERAERLNQRMKAAEYKSATRLKEMQERQAMRADATIAREAAEAKITAARDQKKHEALKARVKIACEKHKIDEICCNEIIQEAIDTGVSASSVEKVLIEGRAEKWIARANELRETNYQLYLDGTVDALLEKNGIHPDYIDACRKEIVSSRPNIYVSFAGEFSLIESSEPGHGFVQFKNSIEPINSPILDKYIALSEEKLTDESRQEEYAKKVDMICKKIIGSNIILAEFSNDLLEEILDTKPPLEHFSKSDVLAKYIKMTADKKSEVNERLEKYLSGNLYE